VTPMSEQSGRNESSDRSGSDRSGSDRSGSDRSGSQRQRQTTPATDMLSDLQRWLLRSSARSVRKEIGGQVRRTFGGGGQRPSANEVWDTATTEIPPEVGESPECQWCPICRAARRMRDSGPGLGGQLSGAGDAVASAVQDAISALDSILSKAGGGSDQRSAGSSQPGFPAKSESAPAAERRDRTASKPDDAGPGAASRDAARSDAARSDAASPDGAGRDGASRNGASPDRAGSDDAGRDGAGRDARADDPHGSVAGHHGPGGWKPGDRLATEHVIDPDPWAGATAADDSPEDGAQPGAEADASPLGPDEAQLDGQGHGPDDRG
jgi:hypothetical protein